MCTNLRHVVYSLDVRHDVQPPCIFRTAFIVTCWFLKLKFVFKVYCCYVRLMHQIWSFLLAAVVHCICFVYDALSFDFVTVQELEVCYFVVRHYHRLAFCSYVNLPAGLVTLVRQIMLAQTVDRVCAFSVILFLSYKHWLHAETDSRKLTSCLNLSLSALKSFTAVCWLCNCTKLNLHSLSFGSCGMLSLSATYCTGSDDKVVACFLSQQLIALVVTTKLWHAFSLSNLLHW